MTPEDATPLPCPECGSTLWKRIATGIATWEEWVETASMTIIEEEDLETDDMDSDEWTCADGHEATDDINDQLADMR